MFKLISVNTQIYSRYRDCLPFILQIDVFIYWIILLFFHFRIAVNRSKMDHSSTMKVCHTVKRIIMQNVDHFVLAAPSQLPVAVLQPCSESSIQNILYAHSVWNNSIKEHSRNKTISHTVTSASINCLAK